VKNKIFGHFLCYPSCLADWSKARAWGWPGRALGCGLRAPHPRGGTASCGFYPPLPVFCSFLLKCSWLCVSAAQKEEGSLSISASPAPCKFSPASFCTLTKGEVPDCRTAGKSWARVSPKEGKLQGFFFPSFSGNFSAVSFPYPACSPVAWIHFFMSLDGFLFVLLSSTCSSPGQVLLQFFFSSP